ncbi:MAG: hypothetical protein ACOX58_07435 [Christensenellales bacterium]
MWNYRIRLEKAVNTITKIRGVFLTSRYAMCPECGNRMRRCKDIFGDWDGETYVCDYCSGNDYDDDDDNDGESLSVYDAALIWAPHGKDEDYIFRYTEDKLEDVL